MNPYPSEAALVPVGVRLLARTKIRALTNRVAQAVQVSPLQVVCTVLFVALIWLGLYGLFYAVFDYFQQLPLEGAVAVPLIFNFFFVAMLVLLTFSNAILTFSSLYGREEAGFLLGMPLHAREVVFVKWFEGVALSSWSFLLLGVPLMLAVARSGTVQWYYYPLFLGHFLGFVAIPACLGLLAAWVVAMWAPRRPLAIAISSGCLLILTAVYWLSSISETALESREWLPRSGLTNAVITR